MMTRARERAGRCESGRLFCDPGWLLGLGLDRGVGKTAVSSEGGMGLEKLHLNQFAHPELLA